MIAKLHSHLLNKNKTYCKWHSWKYHHHIHISILIVYLFSVISFGIIWLNNPPKAHATDPEITTTTLLSGTMPETATITVPSGGEDYSEAVAVYDLGGVYNVTSLQVSCTVSPPTKNTPEWPVGYTFFLSTDNVSYSAVYNSGGSPFSSLHCDENNTFASTTARYAKWRVGASSAGLGSFPSAGTYAETLSNPHLYGTSLGPTVSITTPADNDTGDDPSDIYYTNTTPQTSSGTATPVAPATISTVDGNLSSAVTDATSWTASDIALSPGSNTWTVTATDSSGYTSNASRTIWLDQTNPIISANTPSCSITNSVAVTGTASDSQTNDSGLKTTNPITYTVDGGSTQNASGSTSWTATASSLTEGDHTVAITATDKATNTASTSKTAQYDPTAPSISVTSSSTSSSASYTLTGTTSDATSGVASVSAGTGTSGTTSWSRVVTLTSGANVFSITATDNCGNVSGATSFSVTYTPPVEPPPSCDLNAPTIETCGDVFDPTLAITSPTTEPTYVTATSTVTLAGTASDGVALSVVTYTVNGGTVQTAVGTTSWTTPTVTLTQGVNTIIVTATDTSNNTVSDTITITYTPNTDQENCDLTAPTVSDCGTSIWGTLRITAPNGGECFLTGVGLLIPSCLPTTVSSTTTITWEYTQGTVEADHLKLAYSTDNGITWYSITENIPLSPESYTWTLPTSTSSTQMIVSGTLTDSAGDTISSDSSDATFTLHANRAPEIRIR